jgi:hypothetical protein
VKDSHELEMMADFGDVSHIQTVTHGIFEDVSFLVGHHRSSHLVVFVSGKNRVNHV